MDWIILISNAVYVLVIIILIIANINIRRNTYSFYEDVDDLLLYMNSLNEKVFEDFKEEAGRYHQFDPDSPYKSLPDYETIVKLERKKLESKQI